MTDDYFDQLDALGGGRDYAGTTGPSPFRGGGQALEDFFTRLRERTRSPIIDYGAATAAKGGPTGYNPFSPQGRVAATSPVFQPAQPPERYNVNLLGESIATAAESALGQGFLGTPGAQRGGVMSVNTGFGSFGLATTPVNFQNFATYAREAPLAVMTSILGHKYQQPVGGDPYAAPAGPTNNEDILANISQGDWENVLDNVIDGVAQVGTTIGDVAMWPVDRYREANAISRGTGIRDILATGSTPGTWIARLTSLFDQSRFDWQGIVAKAQAAGWDPLDMAAELWDLNPEVVRQIAANPTMTDEQVEKLVKGEPFSYDPGVNIAAELVANIAPLVVGAGLVRGVGVGGRMLGAALRPIEAVASTTAAGRAGAAVVDTYAAIRAAGLIGKPIAVAAKAGSWSLPQAWRAVRLAEAANRYSLIAGTSIRLGEWGLKQAFELGGNDEMVKVMDSWLWEMPLSNNPGLMLLDAFAVHPMRTGKALYEGAKDTVTLRLLGGADLDVSPVMARNLGAIGDIPLEVAQERLFDKLGWDQGSVQRLFGEDGPHSKTDLYNGLLYVAAQVVRERHETRLRFLEPTADVVSRNEAFWRTYGDEAVSLLQQALSGRGKDADAIAHAIKVEFWERKNLIDAAELGEEGLIGPYDGAIALDSLASWVRASTKARQYGVTGEVLKLREDVNLQVVAAYRERLAKMAPGDVVPVRMLNEIRLGIPAIVKFERGALKRRGNYVPKVTVRQLGRILDAAEAEQAILQSRDARPRTTGVPALPPEVAERPLDIARAFRLRQATVEKLLAATDPAELVGPVPDDLARVLFDIYHMQPAEIRRRPEVAWQRVFDWWQVRYPDAVQRGQALVDIDRFAKIVGDRYAGAAEGGLDAEAFRRIKDSVTHPYRLEDRTGAVAEATTELRNEALMTWLDGVAGWLDSPARTLRVVTGLDGLHYVEVDGFKVADVNVINRLAERAAALDLSPESSALLADPAAHPLEKVGPLREAMAEHPEFVVTAAERERLANMGDFELVYGSTVKAVLGEDTVATRETVQQLTLDGLAAAEEIDRLREQARSLAQVIDRSPTRGMTDELTDFIRRAAALGSRPLGARRRGTPGPVVENWRFQPLTAQGVRRAQTEATVSLARTAAQARLAAAEKMLAEADALVKRVSTMGDRGFHADDVRWSPDPLASFPTKKAALHAASELHRVEGTITGVRKVGSRWKVFEGEYDPQERAVPPPEAPVAAAEAPPAPEAAPVAEPAAEPAARPVAEAAPTTAAESTISRYEQSQRDRLAEEARVGALDRAQVEAAVAEGRAEVERMEAAGEHFGIAIVADREVARLAELRAADYDTQPLPDPITAGEEVQRFTRDALGRSNDLYGRPVSGAEARSAGEQFDARVEERTAEALARVAERRAHEALAQSGIHPQFIGVRSRLYVHPIKVRWQGDTPVPVSEHGKADLANFGYHRIVNGERVPVEQAEPRWVAISQDGIDRAREYGKANKEMGYWSKAAQKELDEAEAWLNSSEAQQLRTFTPKGRTGPVTPPAPPAPEGPPPIVEQIGEAQRVREAQVEAMQREAAAQRDAAEEATAAYQAGRRLPGGTAEEPWPSEQMAVFGEGAYTPAALDELVAKLPPPTADKIAELNKLIDTSIVGARDNAAGSRVADRAVNAAQRELDTKTGAPAREQARMRKELEAAKRRASSIDRAAEQMWADRAEVLEGIKHGINTGRWDATLISAIDQLSGADLVAYIDRAIAELKPKGRLNIGDSSRWFNEHFEEIVRKATDPNEATTDPTIAFGGPSTGGQVDPSLRRTVYRRAPTEALKRWLASADPKRREQISMLNEELTRRGAAPGGGARATGRPVMPTEGGPAIGDAVVIDGVKHRIRRMDETVDLSVAGGHWQQKTIVKQLGSESELVWDDTADVWRVQPAGAAPAAVEAPRVTFLDPADNKTEHAARVVLVDADALLTSDRPGFPPNLQPRSRASRASSDEQIIEYAKDLQPGKLFGVTEGSTGMPVVLDSGAVLAGNGRTMAIRLAAPAQYGKYRAALEAEAAKYGYTPEDLAGMERPMLVRELALPPDVAERLAWQLNEMPIGDLAPVLARELQPSDIRAFSVGDEQTLGDAIRSNANTGAVARMIGRLPRDWHARYFDPKTGLNEPGAKLLEATLLAKILRAEDRAAPGFESARQVVFQVAEQGGEDIRRISGGLAEGAAQLVKVYELAESGAIGPDILTFGDDLAPALARLIELRARGDLNTQGIANVLDNVTAFDEFTLTPTQVTLAKLLNASTSQKEVRTFIRGVARAAEEGPVRGQEAMFADVPQVDYTGLLNEGVKAWNAIRPEGGQMDYFASTEAPYDIPLGTGRSENVLGGTEGPARMTQPLAPEEVDAEIAARAGPGAIHVTETVRDLGPDIQVTEPFEKLALDAAAADYDGLVAEVWDVVDTFEAMGDATTPGRGNATGASTAQRDFYAGLLESANDGSLSAAEWVVLRQLANNLIRKDARGRYNMPLAGWPAEGAIQGTLDRLGTAAGRYLPGSGAIKAKVDLAPGYYNDGTHTYYVNEAGQPSMVTAGSSIARSGAVVEHTVGEIPGPLGQPAKTFADAAEAEKYRGKAWDRWKKAEREATAVPDDTFREPLQFGRRARVIHPETQLPITAEEHAAIVGPDVPFDTPNAAVDAALASTEHTVIVGENPAVNRAVRRAVDAPTVDDPQRRLYEVHPPDARVMAEAAEARQQRAMAAVEAARREIAEADQAAATAAGPEAPTVSSVFPDNETRELWNRLMLGSDLDPIAAAVGPVEPTMLGQLADAVESIDRGMFVDPVTGVGLTADEAMVLRTHLMRLMNGELETALGRGSEAKARRYIRSVTRPPDDFDVAALQDASKLVMDELEQVVNVDPNLPPIEGFLGAQYVLATPPKRSKVDGGPLSPRLLLPDIDRLDSIVPTLKDELQVGRMEDWPRRVGNARAVRLIEHVLGSRPEKEIRARAVANFKREVGRFVDPDTTDATELKRIDTVIEGAYDRWRAYIEKEKVGPYQRYRRVSLLGPERLNAMFNEAVAEEYTGRPAWLADMYAAGQSPAKAWRRADNRIRNYIAESGLPLSRAVEKLYGKAADLGEAPGRQMTVLYHTARFLMDIRWVGLEAIEPMMIAMPRGGVGPVLEASYLRKSSKVQTVGRKLGLIREGEPLAFGVPAQQLALREFAHWAASGDMEQGTGVRWRYLVRELAREQERPFREIVKSMMREEPGLRRIIEESDGGNVDAFLARLDRDWQLAEQGTKEFRSTAEAAAFFKRWLDDGIIDPQTYSEFVEAKRYTQTPQIEAELAKTLNDPIANAVFERLAAVNQSLFHDLTATFFGQENRSNLQRAVNHPFLFWPISYQIKATKWLLKLMLDEFGGVDTGATVAGAFQSVYDEHRRRWVADPAYRKRYADNRTLYFLAGMLFPIVPTELGVSLSPFTRLALNPGYDRPFGIMGVGPIYTNLALVPRLITEQAKEGGLIGDAPPEVVAKLQQLFPQTISITPTAKPPTSTIEAANREVVVPGSVPIPYEQPVDRANP